MNIRDAIHLCSATEQAGRNCYLRRRAWAEDWGSIYLAAGTDSFRQMPDGQEVDVNARDCAANDWYVEDEDGEEIAPK